jgi:MFS family permease
VNVALPSISRELGASSASAQWIVTTYALTFGGLLILGGRASDLRTAKRLISGWSPALAPRPRAVWPPISPCSSPPGRCKGRPPSSSPHRRCRS